MESLMMFFIGLGNATAAGVIAGYLAFECNRMFNKKWEAKRNEY